MELVELVDLITPATRDFSGHLTLSNHTVAWSLNFIQGQLIYAVDSQYAVRRWSRLLEQYCPGWQWQSDVDASVDDQAWPIYLLERGLKQNKLSLLRAKLIIRQIIQECLFELSYCDGLAPQWQPAPSSELSNCRSISLSKWEVLTTFSRVTQAQEQWKEAGLAQIHPMLAPKLDATAESTLPVERQYLDGELTLRAIAAYTNKPLWEIAQSLLALVEQEVVTLETVGDLPLPKAALYSDGLEPLPPQAPPVEPVQPLIPTAFVPPEVQPTPSQPPVIACIDDSPVLTYSIKKILVPAGYHVLTIQEPMRGFSELIEHKPSLILLDLLLPNADGYSVCKFLRDTPIFKETPIIILTGKNTSIDRARARAVGATEFLTKPPQAKVLLGTLQKHLAMAEGSKVS